MASSFSFVPSQSEEGSRMNQNTRKTKLEDSKNVHAQPPKRAALRTITNQARIQPSRAAKQSALGGRKDDAAASSRLGSSKSSAAQGFTIHMDTETSSVGTTSTVFRPAVQSTASTTVCSTTNFSNENEGAFSRSNKSAFSVPLQQTHQNFTIHVDEENIPPASENSTKDSSSQAKDLPSTVISLSRSPLAEISVSTSMDDTSLASEESMIIASSDDEDDSDEVRNEIFNINSRADIVVDVPEYATEIHEHFKLSELKRRPKLSNLKRQQEITLNMRAILVEWLVEVAEEYRLRPQTLHLTINYLDRFLSYMSVEKNKLQLVGVSCMLIAAKYEEIYPPEPSEFAHMTDNSYTTKQILRMEHCILKVLDFGMTVPTCLDFLERYLKVAEVPKSFAQKLTNLSLYLCELSLLDAEPFLKYLPSVIATSSLVLALHTLGFESWGASFEYYTGFKYEHIQGCVQDLHRAFAHAPRHPQQFIRQKYQSERFIRVGHHSPPGSLPTIQFVQSYQILRQ